jgi:hypothetical protein
MRHPVHLWSLSIPEAGQNRLILGDRPPDAICMLRGQVDHPARSIPFANAEHPGLEGVEVPSQLRKRDFLNAADVVIDVRHLFHCSQQRRDHPRCEGLTERAP